MGERRVRSALDRLTRASSAVLDPIVAVVLAPACAVCAGVLDHPSRSAVCEPCWSAVRPFTPPVCDGCGDPLPAGRMAPPPGAMCPACRAGHPATGAPRAPARARAIGEYDGALRALVHALKYDGRRSLAPRLAALMREGGAEVLDGAAAVVPVPLHAWRRFQRGFNQAAELARHLGPPVVPALRRVRHTPTQTSLPAGRRRINVQGAFAPTRAARRLAGATVVLVDDVSTTGATLEACALALAGAGVGDVRALTACRVASGRR